VGVLEFVCPDKLNFDMCCAGLVLDLPCIHMHSHAICMLLQLHMLFELLLIIPFVSRSFWCFCGTLFQNCRVKVKYNICVEA
jgi:hypothetical protein